MYTLHVFNKCIYFYIIYLCIIKLQISHRGTEDATLTMANTIASHLQQAKAYARVLFIDYTSAFNMMQIHLLLELLLVLRVNGVIIHWFKN